MSSGIYKPLLYKLVIHCHVDATLTRVKFGTVTVEPLGNIFAFKTGESNSTLWIGK